MTVNRLILGDNLEILKNMEKESVDLIYLDPPFFSNRNYEVIWGDTGEIRSFQDRWAGGISHYIEWLKERVVDNDGLENTEIVQLRINGVVEQVK
jgi:site-specific DNA-methyltransferase (adenine-specific)